MSCGWSDGLGQPLLGVVIDEEAVTAVDRVDKLPAVQLELQEPLGVVAKHQRRLSEGLRLVSDPLDADALEPRLEVLLGQVSGDVRRLPWRQHPRLAVLV